MSQAAKLILVIGGGPCVCSILPWALTFASSQFSSAPTMTVLGCNFWFVGPPITVSERTGLTLCGAVLLNAEPVPATFLPLHPGSEPTDWLCNLSKYNALREYGALVVALNAFAAPTKTAGWTLAFMRQPLAC
jgi:hypothetical protein